MITTMYSLYDKKAQSYGLPFYAHNDALAMRSTYSAASDPSTTLAQYPGDFTLVRIGTFDQGTGLLDVEQSLRTVVIEVANLLAVTKTVEDQDNG